MAIGGGAPISIQSMTNTKTTDVEATLDQIHLLEEAGCEIVRVAVPDAASVRAFSRIRTRTSIPLVADIHFDYRLALGAIEAGADKIRVNPGNIGGPEKLRQVIEKAIAYRVPIRVGVNSGSIERTILREEGGPTVNALVKSAIKNLELCRQFGAEDLVVSLKSSDVLKTVEAYQQIARLVDVPLHVGVTEAGTVLRGAIKSSIALGILLHQGIGDTIRVSLTGDPVQEVHVAKQILQNLNIRPSGISIISCPTCGRTKVDLESIVHQVEERVAHLEKSLTVAIMGCEVNGPGEARVADIGVACGNGSAVLFKKGQVVRKIKEDDIADELVAEISEME